MAGRYELTDERKYALRASLLVFVATFLVYWTLGPHKTAYDFQLSQANNMIHGHLDMTEEYTRNLRVLERVLYDGKGFCLPVNDPRGPESYADVVNPRITANCLSYMQHSLGPAILPIPFAFVFGLDVNQTLISCFIGALTAVIAFAIIRHFVETRRTQFALTVLAAFGTTYWYSAADGGVWHFAHATAFLFVMLSIWATLVRRSAILAGACWRGLPVPADNRLCRRLSADLLRQSMAQRCARGAPLTALEHQATRQAGARRGALHPARRRTQLRSFW